MALDSTILNSEIAGVQQYTTQDPTGGDPGIPVPPAVLQMLMKTSAALQPKPSAAPPHPQVTAPLAAIPLGYQFAFTQLASPTPYGNTITAYKIYRNKTANQFSGAQLIRTINHDNATNQKVVTVQDSTGGNVNYFYFVTAVDSTGQESSTPGAFQASSVTSGAANPNVANAVGTTNNPTTTSGTYVTVPEMIVTVTTKGNKVLLTFTGTFQYSSTTTQASVAFFRDGVQVSKDIVWVPFGTTGLVIAVTYIDSPAAGSHTFDLRWHGDSISTLTASGTLRQMQVVELG
jgi:hypothetical protein